MQNLPSITAALVWVGQFDEVACQEMVLANLPLGIRFSFPLGKIKERVEEINLAQRFSILAQFTLYIWRERTQKFGLIIMF